jgi:hypothetical protein
MTKTIEEGGLPTVKETIDMPSVKEPKKDISTTNISSSKIRIEERYGRIRWLKHSEDKLVLQQEIIEIFENEPSERKWVDIEVEENK